MCLEELTEKIQVFCHALVSFAKSVYSLRHDELTGKKSTRN